MKNKQYKATVEEFFSKTIYLNVNHLEKGAYILKIVYKNKVIKNTTFKK